MAPDSSSHLERLLAEFSTLVQSDSLVGSAGEFLDEANSVVASIHDTGIVPVPLDPFKGAAAPEPEPDPDLFYTMFWRMFDRTPASMVQAFAIPVRQMLAKRIFRHCGKDVTFHHNVLFSKGSNISVGDNSLINRYVMLDDRSEVTIGSFVMVAAGATIETHVHPFDDFSVPIAQSGRGGLPVRVGDNCVIGYNAVLTAGVTIGYRCIVGANSVVTKDVPDYTVVGGVPAKKIGEYRPESDYRQPSPEVNKEER